MSKLPPVKATPALVFLVVVNLIPIFGVLFFDWDVGTIISLYWLETVIIGALNVIKMWACEGAIPLKLFITVFFTFHFGMFCWGHYTFLSAFFNADDILSGLTERGMLFWTALSLLVSHTFSMVVNFFGQREYEGRNVNAQMFFPYGRIVVMHMVIIFGGGVAMALGSPVFALLILIGLKIVMDIASHSLEHGGKPMHMID